MRRRIQPLEVLLLVVLGQLLLITVWVLANWQANPANTDTLAAINPTTVNPTTVNLTAVLAAPLTPITSQTEATPAATPTLLVPGSAPPGATLPPAMAPTMPTTPTSSTSSTSSPSPSPIPSPTPPLFPRPVDDAQVEAILNRLTLTQKIGQMLMVGMPGTAVDDATRYRIVNMNIGGVIFLDRNLAGPQQVLALATELQRLAQQEGAQIPLFIGWNHEGGRVARSAAGLTHFPSAMALGAANDAPLVYAIGQAVAQEMLSMGVNMNYAPVLDVNRNSANPVIGLRAFSDDPQTVAAMGQQYILGLQAGGVIAVAKHFPGHGDTAVDSHVDLPRLDVTLDALWQTDLPPFQAALAAHVGGVMVAHLQIPALTEADGRPTSLSPATITGLLRGQMGYAGVIMTDDLGMGAISNYYALGEAAVLSVEAGNDLLLSVALDGVPENMHTALLTAVASGRLSEERINDSVRRLLRLKLAYGLDAPTLPPLLMDQAAHQQLAATAGSDAAQIMQNSAGWLPLPASQNQLLLISPAAINPGTQRNDGQSLLGELLTARGRTVTERFYDPTAPADIWQTQNEALALVPQVDAIVVIAWDANLRYQKFGETAQESLVYALLAAGKPVIVIFGQLPYDAERFADAPAQIAIYGDTDGQIMGALSRLLDDPDSVP